MEADLASGPCQQLRRQRQTSGGNESSPDEAGLLHRISEVVPEITSGLPTHP